MLFTTFNGISVFDGANWSELLVDGNSVHAQEMMYDSQNRLWVCATSVKMYDGTNWTNFPETENAFVYGIDFPLRSTDCNKMDQNYPCFERPRNINPAISPIAE